MTDESDHREITVETLSAPPAQIKAAPLTRRIAAGLLDSTIIVLFLQVSSIALRQEITASSLSFSLLAVLAFVYYSFQEGLFSATIGKFLLELRVLDTGGFDCSFGASFKRNSLRFVDWLPFLYILGGAAMMMSGQRQRLGDRFAGTVVTRRPERDTNPPPAPFLFH